MKEKCFSVSPSFLIPLFLLFLGSPPAHALLFLCAVLLHEAGHLIALLSFGYTPTGLSLSLSGAVLQTREDFIPYKKEAAISLAGPFFGVLGCAAALFFLRQRFTENGMLFFSFNFLLTLLNLLPIRGTDGGCALFALLCYRGEEWQARIWADAIHRVFLSLLCFAATWLLIKEKNPSLLILTLSLTAGERKKRKKATITS